MLEMLKSITEKINIINNEKLNNFNFSRCIFLVCLLPFIPVFISKENFGALLFFYLILFVFLGIFYFYVEKIFNYFNKKSLFKLLNKQENKILENSRINFSLFDIKETLFEIQKLCIDNVSSEKELKDILFFILNNKDIYIDIDLKKKSYIVQIIEYIKENKYCNNSFIDLIFEEENNFKISNYCVIDCTKLGKGLKNEFFNLIYEKSSLSQIIKYNNYSEELSAIEIFKKILEKIEIKSLIKIIFEKDKRKLNNNELEILDFFNTLDLEKLVNIKKNILDKTLNIKDKNNIEFYENEFLELCKRLDVDKKLLYIMEESLATKEEEVFLKVISI